MPPFIDIARWIVIALFAGVLALAGASDFGSRRIPNWTVLALAALFVIWIFVGPHPSIVSSLAAAAIVFVATGALYAFNIMGAGDSKLMTVVALFAGLGHLAQFVVVTAFAGGVLALASLAARPTRTLVMIQARSRESGGAGIPYGVAIAIGGALMMCGMQFGIPWPLHQALAVHPQ